MLGKLTALTFIQRITRRLTMGLLYSNDVDLVCQVTQIFRDADGDAVLDLDSVLEP